MMGREREAIEAFEQALAIHPRLSDIARVCQELRKRMQQAGSSGRDVSGGGDVSGSGE